MRPSVRQNKSYFHLFVLAVLVVGTACKLVFWNGRISPQQSSQTKKQFSPITKSSRTKFHSQVQFVFFMGLEGTGHHLIADMAQYSPLVERLRQDHIHPELTVPLVRSLFDDDTHHGLMDAHCKPLADINASPVNMETRKHWNSQPWKKNHPHRRYLQSGDGNFEKRNGNDNLLQRTVQALQAIESAATSKTIFPINVWYNTKDDQEFAASGMMSYPNMKSKCRNVNYPSLDLLYQACDGAKVDCGHVFLHRNAQDVLESTWSRGFHEGQTLLSAIHLYNTQLQIQIAQLYRHADRTMGCVSLLSQDLSSLKDISKWLEYTDVQWKEFWKHHYRAPHHHSNLLDLEASPKSRPYLELMGALMDDALNLCQEIIQ